MPNCWPALAMYRALGGVMKLARSMDAANPMLINDILKNFLQASLGVGTLALGVILGTTMAQWFDGEPAEPSYKP